MYSFCLWYQFEKFPTFCGSSTRTTMILQQQYYSNNITAMLLLQLLKLEMPRHYNKLKCFCTSRHGRVIYQTENIFIVGE